ncbi:MAG: CHAT domain-containing protein, partial [Gammaproteobacteria bacterium]|nr:CHAT domain-containing protein [Gammaproteobacteria bacterium]
MSIEAFVDKIKSLGLVEILKPPVGLGFEAWRAKVNEGAEKLFVQLAQAGDAEMAELRESVLRFYDLSGAEAGESFQRPDQKQALFQTGLVQAEKFLRAGETHAGVRRLMLLLYQSAGINARESLKLPEQAQTLFQTGLAQAEEFLRAGETNASVRECVLRLYYDAGNIAVQPLKQPEQAQMLFQTGLARAEEFLQAGETHTGMWKQVLMLYHNAGVNAEKSFNHLEQARTFYQTGLVRAEEFLRAGETHPDVRKEMFDIYKAPIRLWHNNGQADQAISLLPAFGLWSWAAVTDLLKPDQWEEFLRAWSILLKYSPTPVRITAGFQELLRTLVLHWHDPQRPHRHFGFVSTRILLEISETLYGLEQAEDNESLRRVYRSLIRADGSQLARQARDNQERQAELAENLRGLWKELDIQPRALDDPDALKTLPWWRKLRVRLKLRAQTTEYRKLAAQQAEAAKDPAWQKQFLQAEQALVSWLHTAALKRLHLPAEELNDLPAIALGLLLTSHSLETGETAETLTGRWQDEPPWQDRARLQAVFAAGGSRTWAADPDIPNPLLSRWLVALDAQNPAVRRLRVAWPQSNRKQPQLQEWINELAASDSLREKLGCAWAAARQQAKFLAELFTALEQADFHGNLFAPRQSSDTASRRALAAVVLGDVSKQIENAAADWLVRQSAPAVSAPGLLADLRTLHHRFARALAVYRSPRFSRLGQAVHDWAGALLAEVLESSRPDRERLIWETLERARSGLTRLSADLPEDWADKLGEELWRDLGICAQRLMARNFPTAEEQWLPLSTWLFNLKHWLSKPADIQTCQAHLQPGEALLQPFFDPGQGRLRVLWLDAHGLRLRDDLPEACAFKDCWHVNSEEQSGVTDQWAAAWVHADKSGDEKETKADLRQWEEKSRASAEIPPPPELDAHWLAVMASPAVKTFAQTLRTWAEEGKLTQLTVIFPAPLGQLPWEALPELADYLVRAVSAEHWLGRLSSRQSAGNAWVLSIGNLDKRLKCANKEAEWVAQQWETEAHLPEEPVAVFEALQRLSTSRRVHLSTHGGYNRHNPAASALSLGGAKKGENGAELAKKSADEHQLPLWVCGAVRVPADLMILSACESNVSGRDAENLLAPVGIGPAFAAAGARTVAGTLWPCSDVATLFFSYCFLCAARDDPELPWHKVAARARDRMRGMRVDELRQITKELVVGDDPALLEIDSRVGDKGDADLVFSHPM